MLTGVLTAAAAARGLLRRVLVPGSGGPAPKPAWEDAASSRPCALLILTGVWTGALAGDIDPKHAHHLPRPHPERARPHTPWLLPMSLPLPGGLGGGPHEKEGGRVIEVHGHHGEAARPGGIDDGETLQLGKGTGGVGG